MQFYFTLQILFTRFEIFALADFLVYLPFCVDKAGDKKRCSSQTDSDIGSRWFLGVVGGPHQRK